LLYILQVQGSSLGAYTGYSDRDIKWHSSVIGHLNDTGCWQKVKNCKYMCCETSYKNGKGIQQKQAKLAQILGTLNNNLNQFGQRNLPEKKYIKHWLSSFFSMEVEVRSSDKRGKKQLT